MFRKISAYITLTLYCTILSLTSNASEPSTELPTGSKYTNELGNISFPATAGPSDPIVIKMDFSKPKIYTYEFGQVSELQDAMEEREVSGNKIEVTGKLLLKSQDNKTANLVINDLTQKLTFKVAGEDTVREINSPPQFVPGVKENGKMQADFISQNTLFGLFFPLTEKKIKKGDTFENELTMPFSLSGSILPLYGKSITKLTDFVLINGDVCARFDTIIKFSEPQVPNEIKTKLNMQINGQSVSFFNIGKMCFQQADIVFLMAFSVFTEVPKVKGMDESPSEMFGENVNIRAVNDNYISYSLNSISEEGVE